MNKENLRKKIVIGFIAVGIVLGVTVKPKIVTAEGIGLGYNDDLKVKIEAKAKGDGIKVIGIEVEHLDTEAIAGPAIAELKNQMLKKQDPASLDLVAGASYTSLGFQEGMVLALEDVKKQLAE